MPTPPATVSTSIFRMLCAAGAARGLEVGPILEKLGLDPDEIGVTDGRLPLEREDALWEALADAAGDPCFGLHAWEVVATGDMGVIGYAIRSAPTPRAALETVIRYNRLIHDVATYTLEEEGDEARLLHRFRGDPRGASRHAADFVVRSAVAILDLVTPGPFRPREVWLQHPAPASLEPFRSLLGVVPRFEQPCNAVVFDAALLDQEAPGADPGLNAVLRAHAEELLSRLPATTGLVARCRELLAEALCGGDPSVEALAARLHMSPRTLQRRLRQEGLTHSALVEQLRRGLAERYLSEREVSVAEVAWLLGYSEPSAFHRAFRRWTGRTPAAWRAGRSG